MKSEKVLTQRTTGVDPVSLTFKARSSWSESNVFSACLFRDLQTFAVSHSGTLHNPGQSLFAVRHPQRLLLTLAALITVSSCKSEAPQPPPPKVQAVSTQLAEFTEGVDTVSTLEASNLVELAAQSGGRILELKIRQGDEVAPGQLLVVLDQVEKKAKADTAKANYERYTYLTETGAASQKELDRYRTQYIAAQAELDYSNLTSPSAGTVADVTVKVGDVIRQGQVFTHLVQNNELEARVEVPAVFSSRLALGQPVLLSAPGSEDVIATGAVCLLTPASISRPRGCW